MWVSWWTKRGLGMFFSGFLPFFPTTNFIPPFLHTHLIHFASFHPPLWWCDRRGRPAPLLFTDLQYTVGASSHLIPVPDLVLDTSWGYIYLHIIYNKLYRVYLNWCQIFRGRVPYIKTATKVPMYNCVQKNGPPTNFKFQKHNSAHARLLEAPVHKMTHFKPYKYAVFCNKIRYRTKQRVHSSCINVSDDWNNNKIDIYEIYWNRVQNLSKQGKQESYVISWFKGLAFVA